MKTKAGFTLTEVLVTLTLVGILSGIATVSYRSTKVDNEKRNIKSSSQMWVGNLSTCIVSNGGWKLCQRCTDPADQTECPTPNPPCQAGKKLVFPCKAEGSTQTEIKKNLKKILNYDCPTDADCIINTRSDDDSSEKKHQYHCLSIQKEVSGKKLQVIARVQWSNPSMFDMWCNKKDSDLSDYVNVTLSNICREGAPKQIGGPGANKLAPCDGFQ